ncbi:hypothetical protein D3C71_290190 [compost metagenome]
MRLADAASARAIPILLVKWMVGTAHEKRGCGFRSPSMMNWTQESSAAAHAVPGFSFIPACDE